MIPFNPPPRPVYPKAYLGDGVYATFDGYHLWLAVNEENNNVVALEPQVLEALNDYVKELKVFCAANFPSIL
jgi:hypothetical protein